MSAEKHFLDEIVANPDDDGPRLIYADWLVEHGKPLGDFIHIQCRLAASPQWESGRTELQKREQELLLKYGPEWSGKLRRFGVSDIRFRRGFVDEVEVTAQLLVRSGLKLFRDAPLLNSLDIRDASGSIPAIAVCDALDQVQSLVLRNNGLTNGHLDRLTYSPFVGTLRALDLSVNQISGAGVHHLVALRKLRTLNLDHNLLAGRAAAVLARSYNLANLESLFLRGNRIGNDGLKTLASSPYLASLNRLSASENALTPVAIAGLVDAHGFPSLKHLDLMQNQLLPQGVGMLAGSPWLARLQTLNLRFNGISDAGAIALARSQNIDHLTHLELGGNQIGDGGCFRLADSPQLASLVFLDLSDNRITDSGVTAILGSETLSQLNLLNLRNNPIGEAAQQTLKEHFGERVWT